MGQAPSHPNPSTHGLDTSAPRSRSRGTSPAPPEPVSAHPQPSPLPPIQHRRKPSHGGRKKSLELPDLSTKLSITHHTLRSPPATSVPIPIRGQPPSDRDRERIHRFNNTNDSLLDVANTDPANMNDVLPAPQYHHQHQNPHAQSPSHRAGWRAGYHAPPSSLVARSPSAMPPSPRPASPAPPAPVHTLSPAHKRRSPKKTTEYIYSSISTGISSKGKARAVDVASSVSSTATVPTRIVWRGEGIRVELAGTFDRDWQGRRTLAWDPTIRAHITTVDLRPGTHRLKFIVDEQWKCANELPTAVDDGGNLVNYIEVTEETVGDANLGWEKGLTSAPEDLPPWTSEIPAHLIHAAQLEEQYLAQRGEPNAPSPPLIPHPPALPRHLEKVILNARTTGNAASASGVGKSTIASSGGVGAMNGVGTSTNVGPGGADDNSVLPVPNHVVLNHLGTSAIKGGVLAVGTTTRYHRKYISTIYYKPVS
ncbi:AMPKBI-domain-containing protein [Ceratobasidium sp. AG-I]|nr:AMPKBI-domain-containing protein [Ceratobasidium sp. AG-I]